MKMCVYIYNTFIEYESFFKVRRLTVERVTKAIGLNDFLLVKRLFVGEHSK